MKNTEPRITVAIPHYRGIAYLRDAIESVLAQGVLPHELVICDDGDGEAAQCAQVWGRIRYVKNPSRLGIGGNWNKCLSESKTELTVILHNDDCLLPGYMENILALADAQPQATGIFCEAQMTDENGAPCFWLNNRVKRFLWPQGNKPVQFFAGENGLACLMRGDIIPCSSVCYRMEKLGRERFSETLGQVLDLELYCRLILAGHTLVGLRKTYFSSRLHASNYTWDMEASGARFREEADCLRLLSTVAAGRGWKRAARIGSSALLIKAHYLMVAMRKLGSGELKQAWRMLGEYGEIFPG